MKENKEIFFFSICRGENTCQELHMATKFNEKAQMASYQTQERCAINNHLIEVFFFTFCSANLNRCAAAALADLFCIWPSSDTLIVFRSARVCQL